MSECKTFFVSYTSADSARAQWIAFTLEEMGHKAHVHEWELPAGGNIPRWMSTRLDSADHVIAVTSPAYLDKIYSQAEVDAAFWRSVSKGTNYLIIVLIEPTELPTMLDGYRRLHLHELDEDARVAALADFLKPPARPATKPDWGVPEGLADSRPQAPLRRETVFLPAPTTHHFMGRDADMARLDALLAAGAHAAITAVRGMGGVGKTTMALAYAHRPDIAARFPVRWWVEAETEPGRRESFAALAERLGLGGTDEEERIARARAHLATATNTLIVFDNAPSVAAIRDWLPGLGVTALITTRAPDAGGVGVLDLDTWDPATGAAYLLDRTGQGDEAAARALAEALGGLPLAHEQAAAYCAARGTPLATYRRLFDDRFAELAARAGGLIATERTVYATFRLGIEQAAAAHPEARALLALLAECAPAPVPLAIFETDDAPEALRDPLTREDAIAALRDQALVRRAEVADEFAAGVRTDCLTLHRLIRATARAELGGEAAATAALAALAGAYPSGNLPNEDPICWPLCRRLTAHVAHWAGAAQVPAEARAALSFLLNQDALYHRVARGAFAVARDQYRRVVDLYRQIHGDRHAHVAVSLSNLADTLGEIGGAANLDAAKAALEEALAIDTDLFGPDAATIATTLNNLAMVLRALGGPADLEAATGHLRRAIDIVGRELGPAHPYLTICHGNLAYVLRAMGGRANLAAALKVEETALRIDTAALPPGHPSLATGLNNLAHTLWALGDRKAAEAHLVKALDIYCAALEPGHPYIADVEHALAALRAGKPSHLTPDD